MRRIRNLTPIAHDRQTGSEQPAARVNCRRSPRRERSLAPSIPTLELDYALVKGRTHPTRICTLSGLLGADDTKLKALGAHYGRFLESYREQEWDAAEQLLGECRELGIAELDEVYTIFASRIEEFRRAPKMTDWDGSFTMVEK